MSSFFRQFMENQRARPGVGQGTITRSRGGGGGGGRSGGGGSMSAFVRGQMATAAAAERKRFQKQRDQTLKAGRAAFERARGELSKVGGAARTRIGQSREQRLASSEQNLISRGLGNTTIRGSARRGIESDIGLEQQSLDEMLAGRRSGLEERAGGFELNLGQFGLQSMGAEPNMQDFMRMLQQLQQFS